MDVRRHETFDRQLTMSSHIFHRFVGNPLFQGLSVDDFEHIAERVPFDFHTVAILSYMQMIPVKVLYARYQAQSVKKK